MALPIYNKQELDYAKKDGDYSGAEFDSYLEELISSYSLNDTALGIAKLALDKGTAALSSKQLYVLERGIEEFKMEKCDKCGAIMVVDKNTEGPFFCDFCLDEIRESE